jgi:AraC-like DNA-binding protein
MGSVTSIFARRIVQAAGDDIDGRAMLESIGLDPEEPLDVTRMVSDQVYYDMLERIAREMAKAQELPLRVGAIMRLDDYVALGLAWKSAPTVRASLERVERYCRLWTDNMTYEVRPQTDGILFVLHRIGERRLGMRLSNESTIASATSLIRQTAAPRFCPRAVYLRHAGPRDTQAHERFFRCPIHFGAEEDAIHITGHDASRANPLADDGISRFLLSHLDDEIESLGEVDIEGQVRQVVSRSLSEGVPKMAQVARRMGMSERTLHRRLAERALTFRDLVEATRRELAQGMLRQSRYSLSEVAFLTGFSEQSAFNRAFKRWAGQTPTTYRRQALPSD